MCLLSVAFVVAAVAVIAVVVVVVSVGVGVGVSTTVVGTDVAGPVLRCVCNAVLVAGAFVAFFWPAAIHLIASVFV